MIYLISGNTCRNRNPTRCIPRWIKLGFRNTAVVDIGSGKRECEDDIQGACPDSINQPIPGDIVRSRNINGFRVKDSDGNGIGIKIHVLY